MASLRVRAALLLLESSAAQAGRAMACAFGSSAEFEAALIRRNLEAGAYGPKRRRRRVCAVEGGAFQWVKDPPGNRSSRKQPEQLWR